MVNTILQTLCVPSSCQTSELLFASRKILSAYNHSKYEMVVHVDHMKDENCITKEEYIGENSVSRFFKYEPNFFFEIFQVHTYRVSNRFEKL